MKPITVTGKNRIAVKKKLVRLAKTIAKTRDANCQFCGKSSGQMHGSHCIPVSRGFLAATDTGNIIKLCARCHMRWHEDPTWGAAMLGANRPDVARYLNTCDYNGWSDIVGAVQDIADELVEAARNLGIEKI